MTYLAWEEGWSGPSSFLFLSVSSIFLIRRQVGSGAVLSPQVAWSKWQWALDNSSLACGALSCPADEHVLLSPCSGQLSWGLD